MNKGLASLVLMALGSVSLSAVSGCKASDETVLAEFIAEFARSALAAYLF